VYYLLSKLFGNFATNPFLFGGTLIAVALLLRWRQRLPRLRKIMLGLGVGAFLLFSMPLIAEPLIRSLEAQHRRPRELEKPPAAIMLLTGVMKKTPFGLSYNWAAERLIETVRLAHRYPKARVLILGGSNLGSEFIESAELARRATQMGIDKTRIVIDQTSRNTRENAKNAMPLLRQTPGDGPVLLVTSASHMPRSMACFAKLYRDKRELIAWPVAFRGQLLRMDAFIPRLYALQKSQIALHEYVGLLIYSLLGYI
jgi:uncharacterized SAM-binding protein YcdF (DUF218 family)